MKTNFSKHVFYLKYLLVIIFILLNTRIWSQSFNLNNFTFTIIPEEPSTVKVRVNGHPVGSVIIPSTVTFNSLNYTVTSVEYAAFWGCSDITSIFIPESISKIYNHAFDSYRH